MMRRKVLEIDFRESSSGSSRKKHKHKKQLGQFEAEAEKRSAMADIFLKKISRSKNPNCVEYLSQLCTILEINQPWYKVTPEKTWNGIVLYNCTVKIKNFFRHGKASTKTAAKEKASEKMITVLKETFTVNNSDREMYQQIRANVLAQQRTQRSDNSPEDGTPPHTFINCREHDACILLNNILKSGG